jgi:hypothetical protein
VKFVARAASRTATAISGTSPAKIVNIMLSKQYQLLLSIKSAKIATSEKRSATTAHKSRLSGVFGVLQLPSPLSSNPQISFVNLDIPNNHLNLRKCSMLQPAIKHSTLV